MAHDKQIFIYWDDELTNNKNLELFNMDNKNPDSFADFVDELTNSPSNANACSIDNDDCEGCGS
tara:strand:+ start:210 stop:401 length:192 start_codon:yes stop_codon:yes gene_type:complete